MNVRGELQRLMRATINDRANWTYRFVRPLPVPGHWAPGQKVEADCSHGVKLLCLWAGAPDPMGNGWSTWGNSTTMATHLRHLRAPGELLAGDVVTFGPGGTKHAAMVLEPGGDPLLWSFGHQGGPNTYRLSWDRREAQYLRLPVPEPQPAPDEVLRKKTGYWAWVAWWLGEGDWRHRGRRNPQVRPNVPRLIRPGWWKLLGLFLAARRKGNRPDG